MTYVGIDIGMKGAIAVIDDKTVNIYDMPISNKSVDISQIIKILKSSIDCYIAIEHQQVFPGQGSVSSAKLLYQYGLFVGIVNGLNFSYKVIRPKEWQKFYNIQKRTKELSYETAKKMYPGVEFLGKRGGLKDGRCDAVLIANYIKATKFIGTKI